MAEGRTRETSLERLLEKIGQERPRLPSKQAALAQVVLSNPELVAFGSLNEFAAQVHVNRVTVIRFAQALGYAGYESLSTAIRRAYLLRAGVDSARGPAPLEGAPGEAMAAMLTCQQENLEVARRQLADADIAGIAERLINARRIVVTATGLASAVANLFVKQLAWVGLRAGLAPAEPGVDLALTFRDLGPEDVVVGIASSVTLEALVGAIALARRKQATTVVIGGTPTDPVCQLADYLVLAPTHGGPIHSLLAPACIVETLTAYIAGLRPEFWTSVNESMHELYLLTATFNPTKIARRAAAILDGRPSDRARRGPRRPRAAWRNR